MKFSLYVGGIEKIISFKEVTIEEAYDIIRNPTYKKEIDIIKAIEDKDKRNIPKRKLDYFTFGGTFTSRANDNLIKQSGYAAIDVDDIDNLKEIKQQLTQDKYVLMMFYSPSYKGFKVIIKVPLDAIKYPNYVMAFYNYLENTYNIKGKLDVKTRDISRACFVSYDPDCFLNLNAEVFDTIKKIKKSKDITFVNSSVGDRNNSCFRLSLKLRKEGLNIDQVTEKVLEWNNKNNPPLPDNEVKRTIISAFSRELKLMFNIHDYLQNVNMFYDDYPFFYDQYNIFWKWNNNEHKYTISNEIDLMICFEKYMQLEGQTITSFVKNNYIEALKRVGRLNMPISAPAKWIQFKDKAYSLNSKLIYMVQPNYFFTNPIPWDIGESEDTPMIDKLFIDWVGEDGKQTLYEILAYCCYSDYPIHLIFCFVGIGRNGKSSFLTLLERFIGKDNCCSTELDTLLDNRFESFKLYKKLVCTMGETNFNIISKTSILKKLTGQDLVGFECKNKMPFDDHNYAKILISSNSLPSSNDTSDGFYRRWFIINWNKSFPECKNPVNDIPDQEYKNLAKKVCRLVSELLEKYTFTGLGSIEERKIRYIEASNPLSLFIEKYCDEDVNGYIRYSELYTRYVNYLSENKKRVINKREFTKVLEMEGHEVRKAMIEYESAIWIFGLKKKDLFWN